MTFEKRGHELGQLVDSKQRQYGDSVGRAGDFMRILYPGGIPPHAYGDALLVVRVFDKLCRVAERNADGQDLGGESPWQDIAGYGLLGAAMDERQVDGERAVADLRAEFNRHTSAVRVGPADPPRSA